MSDEKYIKENHLTDVVRRLKAINEYDERLNKRNRLNEYSFQTAIPDEADDNNPNNQANQPNDNQPMGNQPEENIPQQDNMPQPNQNMGNGQNPTNDGMQPPANNEEGPENGDNMNPQGNEPVPPNNGMEGEKGQGEDDMPMEPPQDDDTGIEPPQDDDDVEEKQDGDEVIDVDDLTKAQEDSKNKIGKVDRKLTDLLDIMKKFSDAITDNDAKIDELKKEIAERNPTPTEKMNIRSVKYSNPYNKNIGDYWDKFNRENQNYDITSDNSKIDPENEDEKEYVITKDDIDNFQGDRFF